MEEKEFLTKEKKEELEKELEYRKGELRQSILDRLAFAKSLGDLSENAEYHDSKNEQGKNEARISQLEFILKNAVVIGNEKSDEVVLGSKVSLLHLEKKKEKEYQIVGKEEADLLNGKIGFDSPIAKAILGHKEGDIVDVETPKGVVQYKIISIS